MKKFLSILLALAVGFTFTFGSAMSAFAVTGSTYTYAQAYDLLDTTAKELKADAETAMNSAVKAYPENKNVELTAEELYNAGYYKAGRTGTSGSYTYGIYTVVTTNVSAGDTVYVENAKTGFKALTVVSDATIPTADQVKEGTVNNNKSGYYTLDTTYATAKKTITISRDAAKELFKDEYDRYCKDLAKEVSRQKDALDAAYKAGTETFEDKNHSGAYVLSTAALSEATIVPNYNYTVNVTTQAEKTTALKAELKAAKANQLADLAAINTALYSTTKADGASETPAETAARLVAQATAQVNGYVAGTSETEYAKVGAMILAIEDIYTAGEGTAEADGALAKGGIVDLYDYESGINNLTKAADEVKDSAKLDYAKTKAVDSLTGQINSAMKTTIDILEADILAEKLKANPNATIIAEKEAAIETAKAEYAGILEVAKYYVENQKTVSALATFTGNTFNAVVPQYNDANGLHTGSSSTIPTAKTGAGYYGSYTKANMIAMAKLAAKATKEAEEAKKVIDIAGETYVGIDEALKAAIKAIYIDGKMSYPSFASTAEISLYEYIEFKLIGTAGSQVKINKVNYDNIASWTVGAYDKAKQAEVKGIIDAAKEAVRAAATTEAADTAFLEAYTKLQAVPTAVDHQRDFLSGKYKAKYDSVKAELTAYANYKNDAYNATGLYEKNAAQTLAVTYTKADGLFYTECFTDTELDAMLVEAKAAIDNLKTTASLKEAAAAVNAEITALPKVSAITLADKEAVFAVFDKVNAHNEACESVGDTTNKIRTGTIGMLVGKIKDLEAVAINNAYNAIYKDGVVTVDEAEAVAALRASFDAYNKLAATDYYEDYYTTLANVTKAKVEDAESKLLTAQVKDVVSNINNLPATGATAEQVKALTDAYEALGRDGKYELYKDYYAAYSKLIDAQKLVKFTAEDAKAYVQDLSIAVRTAKVGKKVKVTVNADVQTLTDNGYTVTYKFYKSTKKGSGYKNTVNKTTNTYTNTNPVKGKNYYKVKLVVKNADGAVVATTPLTQCKYGVRTIK